MKSNDSIKKYTIFTLLTMATGVIYKLPYIQDIFYVPMQENLNLTHTQIGNMLSIGGFFTTFGFLGSMYLTDRISKKILIPSALIGVGITGVYLSTFPSYNQLILIWILFALFSDMLYWPILVKSVKSLGSKNEQGRIFGFFEAGRGFFDTIIVFSALYIFSKLGSKSISFKAVILFYSAVSIVIGVLVFIALEDDKPIKSKSKSKTNLKMPLEVIKMKEVWLVSGTIFCSYTVYCGLTYMMPFLQSVYGMPVVLVGIYGVINQYGIKMLAGPIGGYIADKKFKSSSKYFRFSFINIVAIMMLMVILPHEKLGIYTGIVLGLLFATVVNSMKALLFAPMAEINIDNNISGSAISFASFIGYSPLMFCYSIYGNILDRFKGVLGYKILFTIIIGFAVLGILISKRLIKVIKLKNDEKNNNQYIDKIS